MDVLHFNKFLKSLLPNILISLQHSIISEVVKGWVAIFLDSSLSLNVNSWADDSKVTWSDRDIKSLIGIEECKV